VLGGQLHYHSKPGIGTRVEAVLPVTLLPSGTPTSTFTLTP